MIEIQNLSKTFPVSGGTVEALKRYFFDDTRRRNLRYYWYERCWQKYPGALY